jgi:hypothetical protein
MTSDDVTRWEVEIQSWRERYEALVKAMADSAAMLPPRLLADKESYELGRLHGAAAEREACAKLCEEYRDEWLKGRGRYGFMGEGADYLADFIRARSNT